jgi:hypothetical protein
VPEQLNMSLDTLVGAVLPLGMVVATRPRRSKSLNSFSNDNSFIVGMREASS